MMLKMSRTTLMSRFRLRRAGKALLLVIVSFPLAVGQGANRAKPQFDIADFNRKLEVAKWLVTYDEVAVRTSDHALSFASNAEVARLGRVLGKEWFSFQDQNGVWHSVMGRLNDNTYDLVFHYVMNAERVISRTDAKIENDFLVAHARGLDLVTNDLKKPANSPKLAGFIKRNTDKTFTVWMLPASDETSGVAVCGIEYVYTIDQTATKILKAENYFRGSFQRFPPPYPNGISVDYTDKDKPTLGSIYFAWYYRDVVSRIVINNSVSTSTLTQVGEDHVWSHAIKEKKNGGND